VTFYVTAAEKILIEKHYQKDEIVNSDPDCEKMFKYHNLTINVYHDKVAFQGPLSEIIAEYRNHWNIFDKKETYIIGNDEVGTHDYFGPIVITSCYIGSGALEKLRVLGIRDSEELSPTALYELANKIMKIVIFEAVIINNRKYNQWINENYHVNTIKTWGHNQALVKMLQHKIQYNQIVINQFVTEQLYYEYLTNMAANKNKIISDKIEFALNASSKYIAVACSAIISRYLFLEEIKKIKEELNINIPLGAGKNVDEFLIKLKAKMNHDFLKFLYRHTKFHFANTKQVLE